MIGQRSALLLSLILAGCAGDGAPAPSLAPRAVEARGWAEPAAPAVVPAAPDPALDAALDQRRAALAANDAAFTAGARRAEGLARAAQRDAVGDERWVAAQSALASLDERRAATLDAVNEIEQLALDRATAIKPDYPALAELQSSGEAQLAAETTRIAELQAILPAN